MAVIRGCPARTTSLDSGGRHAVGDPRIARSTVCLLLPLLLGALVARAEEEIPPPRGTRYEDGRTSTARYALHDVTGIQVHAERAWLHVWVTFQLPPRQGMYEAVDCYVDCDGDTATGIRGADLYVRVSAGSRFRPNTEKATPPGLLPAFETRTFGWAVPEDMRSTASQAADLQWVWSGTDPVLRPRISGEVYYFAFPLQMLKDHGLRYNARIGLRFEVESILAEEPIWLPYRCVDEGLAIVVDGLDDEWSGGPRARDEVDELHPAAEGLDLRDLQVEHGPDALYARLRLAHPGFGPGAVPPTGDDIRVRDAITLAFEPLGDGGYMAYRTETVPIQMLALDATDVAWAVGDRVLEMRLARPAAQTSFRVMAWSEAWRIDEVPGGGWVSYDVPSAAWKP